MSHNPRVHIVKRAQKEKLLLREISNFFMQLAQEHKQLRDVFISRLELSPDKSIAYVYCYTAQGKKYFEDALELLKLYRPSMRKAISQTVKGRYVPDIRFLFDERFEKQERFEQIMEQIKSEIDE